MIGDRIKLARKRAGFSLRALAEALDNQVSAQAIGKYERGESIPRSGVLIALSKALGVSIPFLLDAHGIELYSVDFRTKANTSAKDRARVESDVMDWAERYIQVESILDMNSMAWEIPFPELQQISCVEEAEDVADRVREQWNLGYDPIPNMTELLEEKGLKVMIEDLPGRVSGLTCLVQGKNLSVNLPVIVVNRSFPLERRRLTLAHELAHRVFDPDCLDPKSMEKAAQRFAVAFLVPRKHLEGEVGQKRQSLGYQEIISLKRLYRVSAAALLVRLRNIGIISEKTLTYTFQTIGRTWRTREPEPLEKKEATGKWEPAKRFERLCYRSLAEGLISLPKAMELLHLPLEKVVTGLRGP